jgi:adenylate cyclase
MNLGLAVPDDETTAFDDDDLDMACAVAAFRAAGIDERGLQGVGRVLGQSMRTVTAAIRELLADTVQPGAGEQELGLRYAHLAEALGQQLETVVAHTMRVHMRDGIRYEVVGGLQQRVGALPGTERLTVAFADLAGFAVLGESLPPARVGSIGDRFADIATRIARPPVRLMKLLGDGAILAGPDARGVVDATLRLAHRLADDDPAMPPLHAGLATGEVVHRRGDLYGSVPNLASRLCALAEPGRVLADAPTREACPDQPWREAGRQRPKGFERTIELFTLQP